MWEPNKQMKRAPTVCCRFNVNQCLKVTNRGLFEKLSEFLNQHNKIPNLEL